MKKGDRPLLISDVDGEYNKGDHNQLKMCRIIVHAQQLMVKLNLRETWWFQIVGSSKFFEKQNWLKTIKKKKKKIEKNYWLAGPKIALDKPVNHNLSSRYGRWQKFHPYR